MASSTIVGQFLCIVAMNDLPDDLCLRREFYGKNVCFCIWCPLRQRVAPGVNEGFFMFLMIRCNGYALASKMHVRLLSSF